MKTWRIASTWVLTGLLSLGPALTSATSGPTSIVHVISPNITCGGYLVAPPIGQAQDDMWFAGFVSGLAWGKNLDVLKRADSGALKVLLHNYCQAHPLASIGDAASVLADQVIAHYRSTTFAVSK